MADTPPSDSRPSSREAFSPTPWSVILAAGRDPAAQRAAFEHLCRAYWLPIYGYLRRRQHSAHDAEDLTQAFFASLIDSDFLTRPDPARGRFRGYLIGALRHFLGRHFEHTTPAKRGGGATFIDWSTLDAETRYAAVDRPQLDPSEAYDTSWALTLVSRALERLAEEQHAAGRGPEFTVLRPLLNGGLRPDDTTAAATQLATTRTQVTLRVHRLRARYAELVRLEVAATVAEPTEVKHEMTHLQQALRR